MTFIEHEIQIGCWHAVMERHTKAGVPILLIFMKAQRMLSIGEAVA